MNFKSRLLINIYEFFYPYYISVTRRISIYITTLYVIFLNINKTFLKILLIIINKLSKSFFI